jgi:alkylated DNA repair dioxygenase AlkB
LQQNNKNENKPKMQTPQLVTTESSGIEDCEYFEYFKNFTTNPEQYMTLLMEEIQFEQNQVFVFGKLYPEPRLTSIHGDENVIDRQYVYSKSVRILKPMTPTLLKLKKLVKFYTEIDFDFVLLNLYRDGEDKVGWHSDDEPMMDCSNIASISFGEERTFKFRDKTSKQTVWKKQLESGSLLWMKENCQRDLEHEVPKTSKDCGPRINLTFRKFKQVM